MKKDQLKKIGVLMALKVLLLCIVPLSAVAAPVVTPAVTCAATEDGADGYLQWGKYGVENHSYSLVTGGVSITGETADVVCGVPVVLSVGSKLTATVNMRDDRGSNECRGTIFSSDGSPYFEGGVIKNSQKGTWINLKVLDQSVPGNGEGMYVVVECSLHPKASKTANAARLRSITLE